MKPREFKKLSAREICKQRGTPLVKCEKCGRLASKEEWGISNRYEHSVEFANVAYPGFGSIPTYQNSEACYVVQPGRVAQIRRLLTTQPSVRLGGMTYTPETLVKLEAAYG